MDELNKLQRLFRVPAAVYRPAGLWRDSEFATIAATSFPNHMHWIENMTERQHVVVVYTDAGGGHKATAEALHDILRTDDRYRVTLVNAYRRVLPKQDLFARWTSRTVEETYNELILRDGRTGLFCLGFYLLAVMNVRVMWGQGRRAFAALWRELQPDVVISVLPLINKLMIDSLGDHTDKHVPFSVLITDWCEMSRAVWFPRKGRYHAICGTDDAYRQLGAKRHPSEQAHRTTGLLLRPAFLDAVPADRAAARAELGLDPTVPVACMLYGGYGSRRMLELAESLLDDPPRVQIIFLCGRDADLAEILRSRSWPFPTIVAGYTTEVHRYLGVSDIFIGKPGPASVSEAHALGLLMLLDRVPMLPQERPILRWNEQQGGRHFRTIKGFRRGLGEVLHHVRSNGAVPSDPEAARNTAAREIPAILSAILASPPVTESRSKRRTLQPRNAPG